MDKYAEDIGHYWQTSCSSADSWIEKAEHEIARVGGTILAEGFGRDSSGWAAFMLQFELEGDVFRAIWPVLPSRSGNERAARIQAATMLYHDIKAKAMAALVKGPRAAFFEYLQLPDGRPAAQASAPELMNGIPRMFNMPQLTNGEVMDDTEGFR